jgi:hypothetical protein
VASWFSSKHQALGDLDDLARYASAGVADLPAGAPSATR